MNRPFAHRAAHLGVRTLSSALASILAAHAAAAEREPVSLRWTRTQGTEDCMDALVLERRLEARLGWDAVREDARRTVTGSIEKSAKAYTARLVLEEDDGPTRERTIVSTDTECEALERSILLALALVVDPAAELEADAVADVDTAPLSTTVSPICPACELPAARPTCHCEPAPSNCEREHQPAPLPFELAVTARALYAAGILPEASWGLGMNARVQLSHEWMIESGLRWLAPQKLHDRYQFGHTGLTAGACRSIVGPLELCATVAVGATTATLLRGEVGDAGAQPWFGAEVAPRASGRMRWLRWEVGTGLGLSLIRPDFIGNDVEIQNSTVTVIGFVGLGPAIP